MDCYAWRKNKKINPATDEEIKENSAIYKKLELACTPNVCELYLKDQDRNPLTGRRIKRDAKYGVFAQLEEICHGAKRTRLIQVLKKHLHPVMNKGENFKNRLKLYQVLSKYLKNASSCITKNSNTINDIHGKPLVKFRQRIGTKSKNGEAYLNTGTGMGNLLKFSVKKMGIHDEIEVIILSVLTEIVSRGLFPHFPIMYGYTLCRPVEIAPTQTQSQPQIKPSDSIESAIKSIKPSASKSPSSMRAVKSIEKMRQTFKKEQTLKLKEASLQPPNDDPYYIAMCELADYDMIHWLKSKHTYEEHESVLMQIIFAVAYFNTLGLTHNDLHLGNILIHHVTPGGYWQYNVQGRTIYIPNAGYLVVLWDFGFASKENDTFWKTYRFNDFMRPVMLINDDGSTYGSVPLPSDYLNQVLIPIENFIHFNRTRNIPQMIVKLLFAIPFQFIKVDIKKPKHVLNKKPYDIIL